MARPRNYLRFRPGYKTADLKRLVAEKDDLLAQYYVGEDTYLEAALDRDDLTSVFVGPKGVGNSAILQMVRLRQDAAGNTQRVIEVSPDDLAFNALVNIQSRTPLLNELSQNIWLFTSLWDYVLSVELLRREEATQSGIESTLMVLLGDRHQRERRKLMKATFSDDGSASTMTDKMLALVREIELEGGYREATLKGAVRLAEERSGHRTEDLKLLQLVNNVAKQLPHKLAHEYYIIIDDLDLHWTGSDVQNSFLGAMFLSIQKLSRSRAVKFVVSIRKNIYREVFLEERDKFSDMVTDVKWSKDQVRQMVEARMALVLSIGRADVWNGLFDPGSFDRIWGHTDGMPREVIRLAVMCVEVAQQDSHKRVEPEDFDLAIRRFSDDRIDDLGSVYLHQYPGMAQVIRRFRGGHKEFDLERIQEVAFDIADLVKNTEADKNYGWVTQGVDDPLQFAQLLVRCGFLHLKEHRKAQPRIPRDEEIDLVGANSWFAINPMYQPALDLK
jgi:hypothetical protein